MLTGPLCRPIDIRFRPDNGVIHIVDSGWFEMGPRGVEARAGSGAVWRVAGEL